ncbi:hypothetical protein QR680_018615 [Steinernema hermaphroditum]|uniref:C-type lectin domain-containing protein n=1 Tax=Steinernema hermaphroditum TaxID=289476 RepID=A0AA39HIJ1_9BILA|nr:hypothetical protein QR680_018615 [Steinernema hermaphroditum]
MLMFSLLFPVVLAADPLRSSAGSPACPSNWSGWNNHCYFFNSIPLAWKDAESFCLTQGAHLTSIQSDEENRFVWNLGKVDSAWIGGSAGFAEYVFTWTDGTQWDAFQWLKMDIGNGACVPIGSNLRWKPTICEKQLSSVCRKSLI